MGYHIYIDHGSYPGFIVDQSSSNCNYGLVLYPSTNNSGNLGKANMAFSHVYSYTGVIETSDSRQKENVKNIDNALSLILKLQGVRYDLKKEFGYSDSLITDEKTKEKFEKQRKNQVGFLAQDVNKILPEVVIYDDSSDVYGIVYSRIVPILVEAMKEQQTKIESLETEIASLSSTVKEKSATITTTSNEATIATEQATLAQNIPNPFSSTTRVDIYLPATVKNAALYIYNMQGTQVKSYTIANRGNTSITIDGYTLDAGMYLYSLIADGKEVDTKKMILTK